MFNASIIPTYASFPQATDSDFERQLSDVVLGKQRERSASLAHSLDEPEEDDDDYDDEDDEAHDESESSFTDPSWYGSPFRQYGASLAAATAESDDALSPSKMAAAQLSEAASSSLASYQKGVSLARRALLQLDEEIDGDPYIKELALASPKKQGKRRAAAAEQTSEGTGTDEAMHTFSSCPTYLCASCGATLALQDELISKAFSGRDGKAYLFFSIMNIRTGPKEDRQLLTGLHTVADLNCATCQRNVGWSYLRAFEASQRYKEGKFILERASLHKANNWSTEATDNDGDEGLYCS